jgi:hypothetical protein
VLGRWSPTGTPLLWEHQKAIPPDGFYRLASLSPRPQVEFNKQIEPVLIMPVLSKPEKPAPEADLAAHAALEQQPQVHEVVDDDYDAQIAALQAAKRKKAIKKAPALLEAFLPALVALMKSAADIQLANPKWGVPFTMRSDILLYNAVLARGNASPKDIMDDIGEYLPHLLRKEPKTGKVPDPLTWVTNTLAEKSQKHATGEDEAGKPKYSSPEYKVNEDKTYSVIE